VLRLCICGILLVMAHCFLACSLLVIYAAAGAFPSFSVPVGCIFRKAPALPASWHRLDIQVSGDRPVLIRFSLRQSGLDELERLARRVSDPSSDAYGQYASMATVRNITRPLSRQVAAVEKWLARAGLTFSRLEGSELIEVRFTVAVAMRMLHTKFYFVSRAGYATPVLRAGDYWLPADVHNAVAAIYGLHGLPARPPARPRVASGRPGPYVPVTPQLLQRKYGIAGVTASGSTKNRQAVAEFQGQQTQAEDLQKFFEQYVPSASATEAKIHRFVGQNGTGQAGGEAELDIEYIMGLAPNVLTEFWYWSSDDLCSDFKNWTSTIVNMDSPPLVHSVSYGIQGPPSNAGCTKDQLNDIDADFAKLAARGITLIFASGDSGSHYMNEACSEDAMRMNKSVLGVAEQNVSAFNAARCCSIAEELPNITAWTYIPPPSQCSASLNSTSFTGLQLDQVSLANASACCDLAAGDKYYPFYVGYTYISAEAKSTGHGGGTCIIWKTINGTKPEPSASSSHLQPPLDGRCLTYSSIAATADTPGAVSGGSAVKPVLPKFFPAWPASSPWVTAVGATRFIGQAEDQPEMASDQFGSGGGFSTLFNAFEDQAKAVHSYLQRAQDLPPNGSFPVGGRATPDVSALGQGYQIILGGKPATVGGTSASAPTFASIVSLLNEARLKAGQPPMGYLNPFLYQNADAFTDVTVGTNAIDRAGDILKYGYKCAKGWDPVTGLGTPVFRKLLSAALAAGESTSPRILV